MLKFRIAKQDDSEALAALINSAYRGEASQGGWTTEAHLLEGLRTNAQEIKQIIDQGLSKILVAFDGSNLVGCVNLERRAEQICYLGMLTVKPALQAHGVGRTLLTEAEKFARDNYHSKMMEMTVITVRAELIAWYERRGYRRTGKFLPFPVQPQFSVLKVKSLEMEILEKVIK